MFTNVHHNAHKLVAWLISKCDFDGSQNDLQWMVLHWEHTKEIPDICSHSYLCSPWHSWHAFYSWHILFLLKLPLYYKRFTKYCREDTLHFISLVCILVCTPYSPQILPQKALRLLLSITLKKKNSSILLLNYLNGFQIVRYLHINLCVDGFRDVTSTTIGFFKSDKWNFWFCSLRSWHFDI